MGSDGDGLVSLRTRNGSRSPPGVDNQRGNQQLQLQQKYPRHEAIYLIDDQAKPWNLEVTSWKALRPPSLEWYQSGRIISIRKSRDRH